MAICPDEVAERPNPMLSSVLIPAEEVGDKAVSLLMSKLDGHVVPDATLLPPRLTVRASTARRTCASCATRAAPPPLAPQAE